MAIDRPRRWLGVGEPGTDPEGYLPAEHDTDPFEGSECCVPSDGPRHHEGLAAARQDAIGLVAVLAGTLDPTCTLVAGDLAAMRHHGVARGVKFA